MKKISGHHRVGYRCARRMEPGAPVWPLLHGVRAGGRNHHPQKASSAGSLRGGRPKRRWPPLPAVGAAQANLARKRGRSWAKWSSGGFRPASPRSSWNSSCTRCLHTIISSSLLLMSGEKTSPALGGRAGIPRRSRVRTPSFHCPSGSTPERGTKIPQAVPWGQEKGGKKRARHCCWVVK